MGYYARNFDCIDCIWHDQCGNVVAFEYFDRGGDSVLTDAEAFRLVEQNRKEYRKAFYEYTGEYE